MFLAKSVTGPAVYHFGVIDFLQNWTLQKEIERAFKIYILRKDPDGLSVMPPLQYKIRFQQKLDQIFDLEKTVGGIDKVETIVNGSADITDARLDTAHDINFGDDDDSVSLEEPLHEDSL